ncbi:hypothetical protein IEQ34_014137 [Dendrobium chrysotoxum]|uniref:Uncharacterized protein n=1 Tax=Dendrobium chrysotoxum TaxID=161865 RepID=A0AAV7GKE3_DENCH|nr:hypothetical protein IEQ34_014137 [Dendrobium chrysotoxum]
MYLKIKAKEEKQSSAEPVTFLMKPLELSKVPKVSCTNLLKKNREGGCSTVAPPQVPRKTFLAQTNGRRRKRVGISKGLERSIRIDGNGNFRLEAGDSIGDTTVEPRGGPVKVTAVGMEVEHLVHESTFHPVEEAGVPLLRPTPAGAVHRRPEIHQSEEEKKRRKGHK